MTLNFLRTCFIFFIFPALVTAETNSAQKIKATEEEIRKSMVDISRQLGVTCTECHKMKNFADDTLRSFKVAKEHMKIVEILKQNGMNGKNSPEASCYMCHKGSLKFSYKEQSKIK